MPHGPYNLKKNTLKMSTQKATHSEREREVAIAFISALGLQDINFISIPGIFMFTKYSIMDPITVDLVQQFFHDLHYVYAIDFRLHVTAQTSIASISSLVWQAADAVLLGKIDQLNTRMNRMKNNTNVIAIRIINGPRPAYPVTTHVTERYST